jgi:hypothetical protein
MMWKHGLRRTQTSTITMSCSLGLNDPGSRQAARAAVYVIVWNHQRTLARSPNTLPLITSNITSESCHSPYTHKETTTRYKPQILSELYVLERETCKPMRHKCKRCVKQFLYSPEKVQNRGSICVQWPTRVESCPGARCAPKSKAEHNRSVVRSHYTCYSAIPTLTRSTNHLKPSDNTTSTSTK